MKGKKYINNITEFVDSAVANVYGLIDPNVIIGKPFTTQSGTEIIPICKANMGYLTGGGDIAKIRIINDEENLPFAGANGAMVSLKPIGFIFSDSNGCRYVHACSDPIDNLIEKTTELIQKFTNNE